MPKGCVLVVQYAGKVRPYIALSSDLLGQIDSLRRVSRPVLFSSLERFGFDALDGGDSGVAMGESW